ncbi:Clavaminate synthase-like protein [Violaceomyces palustris]|uniref:Clavaminate synthase-like protein n=1 Tax=Violaceomyces palustris TaxID=1673888 RepID=A0ACD0P2J2_9BASI|nr:Clavaminate synthase-like protein [Violaceomyces palustris]
MTAPVLTLSPLPQSKLEGTPQTEIDPEFGRIATGLDLDQVKSFSPELVSQIQSALFKHGVLIFPSQKVSPEAQYALTRSFDPDCTSYGHGDVIKEKEDVEKKKIPAASILHPDLKTIPRVRQVQLIGNGLVKSHEGLENAQLRHPHHKTFHDTVISQEDEDKGHTRFYRWHIDAALYNLSPPLVTTLYGVKVPTGPAQLVRYDDGTGETLPVPLGTTAFVSGQQMFDRLSPAEKSLAVRTKVVYAPHPYVWMSKAKSRSTGLGLESQGLELGPEQLPVVEEEKIKVLPMCWKNPSTGGLHLQVHPSAVKELIVSPIPVVEGKAASADSLYPSGAHITDLEEVRSIVYSLQRPAISPAKVYAHDWKEGDFCLFHNQGVLHSVVGAFKEEEIRMFHQCNLAASKDPEGPNQEDLEMWA